MEIIKKPTILCSNHEVLNILKEVKESKKHKDQKNLATVTYEALKYLEETNVCVYQSEDTIRAFLLAIKAKGIRLTKAEKLQLINNRPATLVELQLLIEENEERFSEEALNLILNLVQEYLPGDPNQETAEMPSDDEEEQNGGGVGDGEEEEEEDDEDEDEDADADAEGGGDGDGGGDGGGDGDGGGGDVEILVKLEVAEVLMDSS